MKRIVISNAPADLAGPFQAFAFHQHYIRGARTYDPAWVPSVEYLPPTTCDFGPFPVRKTWQEARADLLAKCSRRDLGRHGQRGIYRLMPDDFEIFWDGVGRWPERSVNSPYNSDNH